jgi:oxygen-independent coproporphyrinogen-3 oxidase
VGPGAHGRLTIDGGRRATLAASGVADYLRRSDEGASTWAEDAPLTRREAAEERVMLGLRISEGVELEALDALGLDLAGARLAPLIADGLLRVANGRLAATTTGRPLLDSLVRALLA